MILRKEVSEMDPVLAIIGCVAVVVIAAAWALSGAAGRRNADQARKNNLTWDWNDKEY